MHKICSKLLIVFLFVKPGKFFFLELNNIQISNPTFQNFVSHIFEQHKDEKAGITILYFHPKDQNLVLSSIEESSTNGIYVFDENGLEEVPQTPTYIIILKSFNEKSILFLIQQEIFDTRSTIILFSTDQTDDPSQKKILELFWRNQYFNVFATISQKTKANLMTYNGYKNSYKTIKPEEYSRRLIEEKTGDLNKNRINALFTFNDHTKIRKLKDYEGKTEKYEGKDYDIIKTIFNHLNADFHVIDIDDTIPDATENPWFSNLDIDNKTDVQREILKKWNITMLTKSQRVLENDGVVEVTYPHTDNAVTLLLPKRRKITKPEEVYDYVAQPVWFVHFTLLAAFSIFFIILRKFYGMINILGPINQLLRIMFTCSSQGFIGRNLEEILLLAWIIWCFLVSIMAQAKITSMLSTDLYENELDSLEDVYRRGKLDFIIFGLNSYVDEVAEKYEGSKYMGIIRDMVKVPMDENLGEVMLLEMPKPTTFKMAIILEHDIAKFYARHMKNRQDGWGRPYLHMMKHSLMPCFQVFHVTAGSPLLPVINRKIGQLVEGGFIDFFKNRFLFKGLIDGYLYPDEDYNIDIYEPESIGMDLAKYAFYLLAVGLTLSTISFMIEVLVYAINMILKYFKSRRKISIDT